MIARSNADMIAEVATLKSLPIHGISPLRNDKGGKEKYTSMKICLIL